jgi:hypothetical protein
MAERCRECGFFEPIGKKFCLTLANNASQDLHLFIKKRLSTYDRIFRYFLLATFVLVCLYYYYDKNNSIDIAQALSNSAVCALIEAIIFLIIYGNKKKKVISKFKEKNPKYLTILGKMGI